MSASAEYEKREEEKMKLWSELFQTVVDMEYIELVSEAKKCYEKIQDMGIVYKGDMNSGGFIISLAVAAVATDRQFSVLEQSFVKDVLDIDDDVFFGYVCDTDENLVDILENIIDGLDIEDKSEIAYFLALLCACDMTVAPAENELVRRLIV